ncbi:Hnm1p [Dipodascopsis uninucleata]
MADTDLSETEKHIANDVANADDAQLGHLGYKAELKRSFSLLSMIGFAFATLTCWTASVLTQLLVTNSWVFLIANFSPWGRGLSYVTGWIQLAGLLCRGSTALFQLGIFVSGIAILNNEEYEAKSWQLVLLCWALCPVYLAINVFGSKLLSWINVTDGKRNTSFVFTSSDCNCGWSNFDIVAILGIQNSAYGMCCHDAPAHMAEELHNASHDATRAMILPVAIGFFTGFVNIIVILFCLVDIDAAADSVTGSPLLEIFYDATKSRKGPGRYLLLLVIEPCDSPTCFIAIYFGSSTAFLTVLSIATVGIYVSYLIPIPTMVFVGENLLLVTYKLPESLGWLCNILGSLYLIFCVIFFFLSTEMPVTGSNMNYCIAAFGITGLFCILWFITGRKSYIRDINISGFDAQEDFQKDDLSDETSLKGQTKFILALIS